MQLFIGLLIVFVFILMGYSVSTYKAPEIQADIDNRTEEKLTSAAPSSPIDVETDGRHVTLRGYAQNVDEKNRLLKDSEDVWGALGPIDEIVVLKDVSPYAFSALKSEDGGVVLSGFAPGEAARDDLVERASRIFGDEVVSEIELASGAPEGDWAGAVETGLAGLSELNQGRLEVVDGSVALTGEAATSETVAAVEVIEAGLADGFAWSDDLDVVRPTVSPFTLSVASDAGGWLMEGHAPDEATRERLIEAVETAAGETPVQTDIGLADGMPSNDWPGLATSGIEALGKLESGKLTLSDDDVRLEGDVAAADLDALRAMTNDQPWDTAFTALMEDVSPYAFSALKSEDGGVVLSGFAPGEAARDDLVERASRIFGDEVVSEIELASGAPEGDWAGAVEAGLAGLSELNQGRLEVVDGSVALTGEAATSETVAAVEVIEAGLADGFAWSDDLDVVRPTVSPFTLSVASDAGGWLMEGHAPDEATRERLIEAVETVAGETPVQTDIGLADGMPSNDWPGLATSGIEALGKLDNGKLTLSDDDVRLEGDVAATDLDALRAMTDGQPWDTELVVLRPTIRPYVISIEKTHDGDWLLAGAVADEDDRDALIEAVSGLAEGGNVETKLQLADGMPGRDWQRFVTDRLKTLETVQSGKVSFEDYDVTLEGIVATPEEAEVANERVTEIDPDITTVLEELDPRPAAYLNLDLSPESGVTIDSVLPTSLSKAEAVKTLGLEAGYQGDFIENGRGDAEAWRQDLATIGNYLPEFETVDINLKSGKAAIAGETLEKTDTDQIISRLTDALDVRWQPEMTIEPTDNRYADGTRRINLLNGIEEEYRRGFWLPVTTITAGLDACRDRTSMILASNKITFLVGEARLDARARGIINDLSAIAIGCLENSGFHLEIGGHTDSRGAADMNQRLSEARAEAVLTSLVARGVSRDAMVATGYGEHNPIADNTTAEGRAANRRITFKWLEAVESNS